MNVKPSTSQPTTSGAAASETKTARYFFKAAVCVLLSFVLIFTIPGEAFAEAAENSSTTGSTDTELATQESTESETETETDSQSDAADSISLNDATITLAQTSYVYTGAAITPELTVTLNGNTLNSNDYIVTYHNNTSVGTATVTATGTGNYTDSATTTFNITKATIKTLTLKTTSYTYNGQAKKPGVTVQDSNGNTVSSNAYSVSYKNNTAIGTATVVVTVTDTANYNSGSLQATFTIKPASPTIKSTTPSISVSSSGKKTGNITVKWSKVSAATGYKIYRATSKNGTYTCIKTITSNSTVSYKNTKLTVGKTYYYKVRAYKTVSGSKKYSAYSSIVSQKSTPAKASVTKTSSAAYNKVTVTWKKVTGASGYAIYRATSKNGTYKRVGLVKSGSTTSYTASGCTAGKTYYYKVRAYTTKSSSRVYGPYSAYKTGKSKPAKVSWGASLARTSTTATLSWKKVAGASGYEIYRATSKNGTYKKVKTITGGSTTKWTNKSLSTNKNYYYKIRAYRTVSGSKVYGSYSSKWLANKTYASYTAKANKYSSSTKYLILVNTSANRVAIFKGSKGSWSLVKFWKCTSGASSTPTVKGVFTVKSRGTSFGSGYTCWYWTQFYGNYLFHSVLYYQGSSTKIKDGRLGINASHGCVRLAKTNAKWIYNNIPRGTKVVIY